MHCFKTGEPLCPKEIHPNPHKIFVSLGVKNREAARVYDKIVLPVIEQLKWDHYRADALITSKDIMCKICERLQEAGWCIAIAAGKRHNVFFELGLAYGLSKQALIINREGNQLPSDLAGLEFLPYTSLRKRDDVVAAQQKLKDYLRNGLYPWIFKSNFAKADISNVVLTPSHSFQENSLCLGAPSTVEMRFPLGVAKLRTDNIRDFTITAEMKIIDDGGYADNWVGYKLRAFHPGFPGGGYTLYLRSSGSLEVQAPDGNLIGGPVPSPQPRDFVTLKTTIQESTMRVTCDGNEQIVLKNLEHRGAGAIFIETCGAKALFKTVEVRNPE